MDKQINIQEALDWYLWAGVDETCADSFCLLEKQQPFVLYQQPASVTQESRVTTKAQTHTVDTPNPFTAIYKNARDICTKANNLSELKLILQNFDGCNLKNTAAHTILGDGATKAKIMLIGESPGADEDRIGKPFVGRCGKLLDKMFNAINIKREDCYITNVLPWRPPGNRNPTDEEVAICLPFLKRQIELIEPDFILLLGGIALKSVMDISDPISRIRGKWFEYKINDSKVSQVLATYHPSYLLRSSAQKSKVWIDLLRLKKEYDSKLEK